MSACPRPFFIATGFGLALQLGGCASPMIESLPVTAHPAPAGLVYALPKAQVLLQASRKLVQAAEVDAAKKDADDTAAAAKAAQAKQEEAEAARKAVEAEKKVAVEKKVGAEAMADIQRRLDLATVLAALNTARAELAAKKAAAAKAAYETVRGQVGKWVETASLALLPHAPDEAYRFVARHQASEWRDDVLALTVNNGLLSSGEGKATGQASSILLNLARAVAGVQATPSFRPKSTMLFEFDGPTRTAGCKAYDLERVFDPTNPKAIADVAAMLETLKADVALTDLQPGDAGVTSDAAKASLPHRTPQAGLIYRGLRNIHLQVAAAAARNCTSLDTLGIARLRATVPDAATLFVLPVQGAAFSKSTTKHVFKDGLPTEVSFERPSTAAALAGLPVDILKALVSIPAELIKLRVDYSSQEAGLVSQQVKLLEAQMDLIKAKKELQAAQEADTP